MKNHSEKTCHSEKQNRHAEKQNCHAEKQNRHAELVSASVKEIPKHPTLASALRRSVAFGMTGKPEIFKLDGVGINLEKFRPCESDGEKSTLRKKYKYDDSDFIILYIAEFIPRKDHEFFIKNIPLLKKEIPNLKVIMPGKGAELKEMKILAVNLEVDEAIWFPGYRRDINLFCRISDLYAATSRQEGLPVSVIEAMASGLSVVASNIRGQTDAIQNGKNGYLYTLGDSSEFVEKIVSLYKNSALRLEMGKRNVEEAKKYSVKIAVEKMAEIYKNCEKN